MNRRNSVYILRFAAAAGLLLAVGCDAAPVTGPPDEAELLSLKATHAESAGRYTAQKPVLPDVEPTLPDAAARALARIGEPSVPALRQALSDPDPEVRRTAARSLARMGRAAKEAVPDLVAALDDEQESVRLAAIDALGQIGPEAAAAVPDLVELVRRAHAEQAGDVGP